MRTRRQLKDRNVVFRLSDAEVEVLDSIAERESLSRAQVIRRFIKDGLERDQPAALAAAGGL